jgi:hypothetical protein
LADCAPEEPGKATTPRICELCVLELKRVRSKDVKAVLSSLEGELREIVWLAGIVEGLSIGGAVLAVALVSIPGRG